ncbi:MAG: 3-oxoacyl-ACP reductase FabG [Cutibacterium avidum]|uniref:Beta-ketoacyl-ACP reductase n=1 Tax=Cutibacterium avidum TaxID=33010 RepID=A0A3E2DGT4_9ACTN|nr:3-oxoacyl-ACP reductase FabG [Cutibacterium avidum]MBS5745273.1 3-oxoacyl-ACP reductase FabG [Propionibacterium sp.]MDU7817082.1 3-oxoacyl-ACP reductase FabG [Bacillota bacterium]MDK7358912.1 3-oxoacyl-ACP reductase FabG [Cutibacterium avidum]MDK7372106.1 3-oxoacyl-ACP reductase FabG [Cutibacterium avidum]MDU2073086.1 3-oxoacyl-ACP reductase FabG [Cutibacterium avidum]
MSPVALVTGGSRGIGRAIAERLGRDGFDVAVVASSSVSATDETCRAITAAGQRAQGYACDVSDSVQVKALVKRVQQDLGQPQVLVNNAGIIRDNVTAMINDEDFDRVMDVNLRGAFLLIRECYLGLLRQRTGSIINVSSVSGISGNAGQSNYAAAKAGLIGLTKSVARELAERGVRCNAVAPGVINTDMAINLVQDDQTTHIPMRRVGLPEEVAGVVSFLAGSDSTYVTGTVVRVDGGLAM